MNRLNGLVRRYFRRSPAVGIGSIVLALCLAIAFSYAVWDAYAAPAEEEREVTLLAYTQSSDFGYRAQLGNNTLFGNVTLTEDDTAMLFLAIVDELIGVYSYSLSSSGTLDEVYHEVRIEAVLASPDNWSKSIVLVPETARRGAFALTFPIATDSYLELINTIEEEIGIQGSSYDLTIRASVRTEAASAYGPIDETLTHVLRGALQANRLTWSEETPLSQMRDGALLGTEVVTHEPKGGGIGWAFGLVLVVLCGVYAAWNYVESRPPPLTEIDREAKRAKRKHEDVIVDVERLPNPQDEEIVMGLGSSGMPVVVSSLEELLKISESLLKPVLHKAERSRHVYRVIDGLTTYEYVSEESGGLDDFETADSSGPSS